MGKQTYQATWRGTPEASTGVGAVAENWRAENGIREDHPIECLQLLNLSLRGCQKTSKILSKNFFKKNTSTYKFLITEKKSNNAEWGRISWTVEEQSQFLQTFQIRWAEAKVFDKLVCTGGRCFWLFLLNNLFAIFHFAIKKEEHKKGQIPTMQSESGEDFSS